MLSWWICSKIGYHTDMAGAIEDFFWLTRLANAMYCTVFLSDDPKVRCGGFNWVNNQCRDLDCIIWPEHIWSISKGIATSLSRWPGAMCIIFLQMQVRGDAPSMFNLTQQARTHMNEWMSQRQVWQRCLGRNGDADEAAAANELKQSSF
jgi:hypothetical protein